MFTYDAISVYTFDQFGSMNFEKREITTDLNFEVVLKNYIKMFRDRVEDMKYIYCVNNSKRCYV